MNFGNSLTPPTKKRFKKIFKDNNNTFGNLEEGNKVNWKRRQDKFNKHKPTTHGYIFTFSSRYSFLQKTSINDCQNDNRR